MVSELDENQPHIGLVQESELCIMEAPSLIITMETGTGHDTYPMLLLESSFEAKIHDWSSKMYINSSMTLQVGYYNYELALWEPLIETVEIVAPDKTLCRVPWELKIEIQLNSQEPLDNTDVSLSPDEHEELKITSNVSINVTSSVNLELNVTKTCLEVLSNLGQIFQSAVKEGVSIKSEVLPPYRLVNDTGLKLKLLLSQSDFKFFSADDIKQYEEIIVESDAEVPLQSVDNQINLNIHFEESHEKSAYMLGQMTKKYLVVNVSLTYI